MTPAVCSRCSALHLPLPFLLAVVQYIVSTGLPPPQYDAVEYFSGMVQSPMC
jgi:hypothetical protein